MDTSESPKDILKRQEDFLHFVHSKLFSIPTPTESMNSLGSALDESPGSSNIISNDSNNTSRSTGTKNTNININNESESSMTTNIKNILVVTHGGFIKRFLSNFCSINNKHKIANCSVTVAHVLYNPIQGNFTCSVDESLMNDTSHLK